MYWRLIYEPLRRPRSRRRSLWSVIAIALGTAVAAAMLNVSIDIGDRMGEEVRALGPNVVVTPAAQSLPISIGDAALRPVADLPALPEGDLPKLKSIFWRNNIRSFSPFLSVDSKLSTSQEFAKVSADSEDAKVSEDAVSAKLTGVWFDHQVVKNGEEIFRTGIRELNPAWAVAGNWPTDEQPAIGDFPSALVGERLAGKIHVTAGDVLQVSVPGTASPLTVRVSGVLSSGSKYDDQVLAPLVPVQALANRPGQVDSILVSALIKPEDELSRRDPKTMSPADYDRWFCAPYLSSIMYQIGGALPGAVVRPIREVAETQGSILSKLNFLMALLAVLALAAAAMGISSLASLAVLERRQEIAVMKAIGARDGLVSTFLMTGMALEGLSGGVLGFFGGQLLAIIVGRAVFDTTVAVHWILLPAMISIALLVSLAGTWLPVMRAVRQEPAPVLRGE